ncbi:MAG: substrate-binding domain-containing protein [Dysgonamonadaceae bacterium]|jgi:LacI family transcriptional regulator|nr:substrate-binding domain-containing protein [Dysgonamonadaceae bacterium]
MAKKNRIKDIAELAGVSVGTVDRIIHNRGDVSLGSRVKVEKVLAEINYSDRLSTYLPEYKGQVKLLIILPQHTSGEYWESIEKGINTAVRDFANVKLKIKYLYYDQFNLYSCRQVFDEALTIRANGVIIGPSFYDETVLFANQLFLKNIPYVFVDTIVNNTKPLAFFGPHPFQTGTVQAKLLTTVLEPGKDIVLFQAKRIGDATSVQSLSRSYGFMSYLKEHDPEIKVFSALYDNADKNENRKLMEQFFAEHSNIGGAVVFDTRAYVIAEYLKTQNIPHIKLIGYGTDKQNITDLKEGYIDFLISERPEYQGYSSIKVILEYLLCNKTVNVENYTPIDILIKETVDFYLV